MGFLWVPRSVKRQDGCGCVIPAEPRRGARREVRGWPSPCWLDFLSLWGGGGYFCSSMPLFFFFFQKTHEL